MIYESWVKCLGKEELIKRYINKRGELDFLIKKKLKEKKKKKEEKRKKKGKKGRKRR